MHIFNQMVFVTCYAKWACINIFSLSSTLTPDTCASVLDILTKINSD